MISTLLFVWHKVSSLPPRTQNLNLRFHPDHEYQCPINLYTGYFRLLFCMSIRLSGYEREITMMSTLILYDTQGFLPSSIYPNPQYHKYYFQLTSLLCTSMTSTRLGKRKMTPLFCMSITIMRLGKRNNHDIYFTFCMTQGFVASSSYPRPQYEIPSRPLIPVSNQRACMTFPVAITSLYEYNHYEAMHEK